MYSPVNTRNIYMEDAFDQQNKGRSHVISEKKKKKKKKNTTTQLSKLKLIKRCPL